MVVTNQRTRSWKGFHGWSGPFEEPASKQRHNIDIENEDWGEIRLEPILEAPYKLHSFGSLLEKSMDDLLELRKRVESAGLNEDTVAVINELAKTVRTRARNLQKWEWKPQLIENLEDIFDAGDLGDRSNKIAIPFPSVVGVKIKTVRGVGNYIATVLYQKVTWILSFLILLDAHLSGKVFVKTTGRMYAHYMSVKPLNKVLRSPDEKKAHLDTVKIAKATSWGRFHGAASTTSSDDLLYYLKGNSRRVLPAFRV